MGFVHWIMIICNILHLPQLLGCDVRAVYVQMLGDVGGGCSGVGVAGRGGAICIILNKCTVFLGLIHI